MIVNHHKGRIWAESGNNGAVFSFVLPFHSDRPASPVTPSSMKAQQASGF
jgi:hypothetical protein